jgi:hypothetical protein
VVAESPVASRSKLSLPQTWSSHCFTGEGIWGSLVLGCVMLPVVSSMVHNLRCILECMRYAINMNNMANAGAGLSPVENKTVCVLTELQSYHSPKSSQAISILSCDNCSLIRTTNCTPLSSADLAVVTSSHLDQKCSQVLMESQDFLHLLPMHHELRSRSWPS